MHLDGAFADVEALGDGPVGQPLGHEGQNLAFSVAERTERVDASFPGNQLAHDERVDDALSGGDAADGVRERGEFEHTLLEQVADGCSAAAQKRQDEVHLDVTRRRVRTIQTPTTMNTHPVRRSMNGYNSNWDYAELSFDSGIMGLSFHERDGSVNEECQAPYTVDAMGYITISGDCLGGKFSWSTTSEGISLEAFPSIEGPAVVGGDSPTGG